jgi:hypothetical protein
MYASLRNQPEMVNLLLDRGASINLQNKVRKERVNWIHYNYFIIEQLSNHSLYVIYIFHVNIEWEFCSISCNKRKGSCEGIAGKGCQCEL